MTHPHLLIFKLWYGSLVKAYSACFFITSAIGIVSDAFGFIGHPSVIAVALASIPVALFLFSAAFYMAYTNFFLNGWVEDDLRLRFNLGCSATLITVGVMGIFYVIALLAGDGSRLAAGDYILIAAVCSTITIFSWTVARWIKEN